MHTVALDRMLSFHRRNETSYVTLMLVTAVPVGITPRRPETSGIYASSLALHTGTF